MTKKNNFNIIEKYKYGNIDYIAKFINNIVNRLMKKEFINRID